MIALCLLVFVLSVKQIAGFAGFQLNFCDTQKTFLCSQSMYAFFHCGNIGHACQNENQVYHFYVNYPRDHFVEFIKHCNQFHRGAVESCELGRIPQRIKNKLTIAVFNSKAFFDFLYPDWLLINGIDASGPQQSKFSLSVTNWFARGHHLYPAVWDRAILLEPVALGMGVHSSCHKVKGVIGNVHSASKNSIENSVLKMLAFAPTKIVLPKMRQPNLIDNLIELQLGSLLSSHPHMYLTANTIVLTAKPNNNCRFIGYLVDYAASGTLQDWFVASICNRHLTMSLIGNLFHIAKAIHMLHKFGYLHCDIKMDNIFVVDRQPGYPYSFRLGDFGNACRIRRGIVYNDKKDYERGYVHPIELFERQYRKKIGRQTDWYQFGYLLWNAAFRLMRAERYLYFQLFGLLIQGLAKYSPLHGRFGFRIVNHYMRLFTTRADYLLSNCLVKTVSVTTNTKGKHYCIVMDRTTMHSKRIELMQLAALNGVYMYGTFILVHQFQRLHQSCYLVDVIGEKQLSSYEFEATNSSIFMFVRDFPGKITGSFNFLSQQRYFKNDVVVIESNVAHWICFCDDCCLGKQERGPRCIHRFTDVEFLWIVNAAADSPYVEQRHESRDTEQIQVK